MIRNLWVTSAITLSLLFPVAPASAQLDLLRSFGGGDEPTKKIAYFTIRGALAETPTELPPLFGSEPPLSLKTLLDRFKEARHDDSVVAIVVDLDEARLGLAQVQEIHAALRKFAGIDKEVYVHGDSLHTASYAAATGASHISIVPTGDVWLTGFYAESPYLRGTLEKIGCVPDFEYFEDYKSAHELFTRTGPSDESRRMMNWLLDSLYEELVSLIGESRGITPERVRELIDGGPYTAEDALAAGLIDSVKFREDFIAGLKARYGESVEFARDYGKKSPFDIPDDNIFAAFEFLMKMLNPMPKVYTTPSVAIVYVEGPIQTGTREISPFGAAEGAFSTTIRRALDRAENDSSVRAVVLRVDSPGGSALASEIILNASKRVAGKKPLVVSMGNVAGSGGYYVACGSETIFADRSTITASIGVVGGKIVTTGMWDKLGVNWHAHQRGAMAAIMSTSRKFNDAERKKFVGYMKEIYDKFKGHVVAARGEHLTKPIDQIAGGRVFTGVQALDLGLIDKIGGLEDAIRYAAQQAKLGEYDIRVIPEPPTIFDLFLGGPDDDEYVTASAGRSDAWTDMAPIRDVLSMVAVADPLRAKVMLRMLQRVELIRRERAIMMMPEEILIR